jgi:hypothetical protein
MTETILLVVALAILMMTMKYVWTKNTERRLQPIRISNRQPKRRSL